jgi:hypothetical protein
MKNVVYLLCLCVLLACKKKEEKIITNNIFPKTSWKSAEKNKFPLYYQFTDSVTVLIRDDSGEIANMYQGKYVYQGDTLRIEVVTDEREAGTMNGYKQTLYHKNNVLYLVSDQMPNQKIDMYAQPDSFIKENLQ